MSKSLKFAVLTSAAVLSLSLLASGVAQANCYGCEPQPYVPRVQQRVAVPYPVAQPYPVPQPYPVIQRVPVPQPYPVVQRVNVPVPQPYPVVQRVNVPVPQPYPVVQRVNVPVPQPYPVVQRVEVPVVQRVEVPVIQRVEVPVIQRVEVPVIQRVVERVEVPVEHHVEHHAHVARCGDGLLDGLFGSCGGNECDPCGAQERPYFVDQGPVISGPGLTRAPTYIPPRRVARTEDCDCNETTVAQPRTYAEPAYRETAPRRRAVHRAPPRMKTSSVKRARVTVNGHTFTANADVHVVSKKRVDIKLYRD